MPTFNPFDKESVKAANQERRGREVLGMVMDVISAAREGITTRALEAAAKGRTADIRSAVKILWEEGKITAAPRRGKGGGVLWSLPK